MSKKIEFRILPYNSNLHEDFLMRIPSMDKEFILDTYHFWDGQYYTDNYQNLTEKIRHHLLKCKNAILKLLEGKEIYIPIDFSDQYYGVFEIKYIGKNMFLFNYGLIDRGFDVGLQEEGETTRLNIGEQKFQPGFHFLMSKDDVVDSFSTVLIDGYEPN